MSRLGGQAGKTNCVFILWWWQTAADATLCAVCVCVVVDQKSAAYLFGQSAFVPGHQCDAALCSYAFIWKIGQFPRDSPSPSTSPCVSLSCCLSSHVPSRPSIYHSLLRAYTLPFFIFSNHSFSFSSPLDHFLTYLLPAFPLFLTLCVSSTHSHANTSLFIYTHSLATCLLTHFFHTHTHTHTHTLSHCSLTEILPSVSSSYKSIVLSYIIRSALRQ